MTTSVNSTVRASMRSSGSRGTPAGPAITRQRLNAAGQVALRRSTGNQIGARATLSSTGSSTTAVIALARF